jgi:hypothetical protein
MVAAMPDNLPIQDLSDRHYGLTPPIGSSFTEAASVCLQRHHSSPAEVEIRNDAASTTAMVVWTAPDARQIAAWANDIDATEAGAYACVIAAVELTEGMFAVHRAETKTGADYYIGPVGHYIGPVGQELDLETALRLEVSGTDSGTETDVAYRLQSKVEQTRRGNSNLPAIAGVIGFKVRLILLATMAA